MKKNKNAQNEDTGSCAMPSGYATNANPGPATVKPKFNGEHYS